MKHSRIVAIANQKGGVGKTTTAVNLAACLGAAERKTLLIDLDPQGNATSGLGVYRDSFEKSVYDAFVGDASMQDVILSTAIPFLFLAPANTDLIGVEVEFSQVEGKETLLKGLISQVKAEYQYILIDCPPSLGLLTLNSLTAADSVLIPLQCEYYALEGLSSLLHTIDLVKKGLNPDLSVEGIALTMFDGRNNLSKQVAQDVASHFKGQVYDAVIPRNVRLSESPSHGKPILLYDAHCIGAASYLSLAREFMGRVETPRELHK